MWPEMVAIGEKKSEGRGMVLVALMEGRSFEGFVELVATEDDFLLIFCVELVMR